MAEALTPTNTLKALRAGPSKGSAPTGRDVTRAAERHPEQFARAIRALFYKMVDAVLRKPQANEISRYVTFSAWREAVDTDEVRYYSASLDAYQHAASAGLAAVTPDTPELARDVAKAIASSVPAPASVEGLAWRVLLGQVQSVFDRDQAAATFLEVRQHEKAALVAEFYRDMGANTYYSEQEVVERRRELPSLSDMTTWSDGSEPQAKQAIVISVDPHFFRIYGPAILHNAQQVPALDFVVLLCTDPDTAEMLRADADVYLRGLAVLDQQPPPTNVRLRSIDTPPWVALERTFFASARFLALPGLLKEYESVYAIDADLHMVHEPRNFMRQIASVPLSVPRTSSLLGVSPWRRNMAGNTVANRSLLDSPALTRLLDYLSVGLSEPKSWMLDQNALTYAIEGFPKYEPLAAARPVTVGKFMGTWESNYFKAVGR